MMKFLVSALFMASEPSQTVGYAEIPFQDPHQKIERTLMVWYPVGPNEVGSESPDPFDGFLISDAPPEPSKKWPVVVLSHGNGGDPHHMSWLTKPLVQNGFLVIGTTHLDPGDGKYHIDHWKRARDVSVLIDELSKSRFAKNADMDRIGIAGFSLGGTTAVWLSGARSTLMDRLVPGPESVVNPDDFLRVKEASEKLDKSKMSQDWRDSRIKAAVLLAPAWGWIFDEKDLKNIQIPVYISAPANDGLLVTKGNAEKFAKAIPNATYREIPGNANHRTFISSPSQKRLAEFPEEQQRLVKNPASVDPQKIQQEIAEDAVRFFRSID